MNLVFIEDTLEHLTRIHRIVRLDLGNALLVGVGGSEAVALQAGGVHLRVRRLRGCSRAATTKPRFRRTPQDALHA